MFVVAVLVCRQAAAAIQAASGFFPSNSHIDNHVVPRGGCRSSAPAVRLDAAFPDQEDFQQRKLGQSYMVDKTGCSFFLGQYFAQADELDLAVHAPVRRELDALVRVLRGRYRRLKQQR